MILFLSVSVSIEQFLLISMLVEPSWSCIGMDFISLGLQANRAISLGHCAGQALLICVGMVFISTSLCASRTISGSSCQSPSFYVGRALLVSGLR